MSSELMEVHSPETQPVVATESLKDRPVYIPRTDVWETRDEIVLLADMPGATSETIDITLEKNILTVAARALHNKLEGYELVYTEYEQGDYKRVFTLSNEIDREGIQASMKDGVLKLVLPKSKSALPKKIEVKVG